jgi:RNA polymerase sigma-70 factor (ECF subfamily)
MEKILSKKEKYSTLQLYELLITEIHSELYKYIYIIVRNQHMADDIIQETYLQGYKNFNKLREKEKFKSWIFTIAKHEAIKTIRNNAREVPIEKEECIDILDNHYSLDDDLNNLPEIYDNIADIINSLDHESKDILNLIYYSDFALNEVAIILKMNYNTLKSKHKRLKERIYTLLKERNSIK